MSDAAERKLLEDARDGFDTARRRADEGDALASIAISLATAGSGVVAALLNELDEIDST